MKNRTIAKKISRAAEKLEQVYRSIYELGYEITAHTETENSEEVIGAINELKGQVEELQELQKELELRANDSYSLSINETIIMDWCDKNKIKYNEDMITDLADLVTPNS